MSVEPIRRPRVKDTTGGNHGPRIVALERKVADMHSSISSLTTQVETVKDDTETIRDILVHTKSIGGFVAKHGPRVIAFALGGLVLSGKMPTEWAALIKVLFGI